MFRIPSISKFYKLSRRPSQTQKAEITTLFHSWVLYYFLQRVHKEFLIKSTGRADSMGLKWKPLSPKTEIYKPLIRGEIAPGLRRRIREGRISKKEALKGRKTLINIRTGRLEKALRPGRVINGEYISQNPDQLVRITSRGFSFDITIDYSDDVQDVRPFLPEDPGPWIEDAILNALPKVRIHLRRMGLL